MVKAAMAEYLIHEGVKSYVGAMAIMELKDMFERCAVLVVPIHCDSPLHWTFLEVGNEGGAVKYVKYYDWCKDMHKSRALAQLFLIYLEQTLKPGEKLTLDVPAPSNKYVQRPSSNDCAFALWSCLENAMKWRRNEMACGVAIFLIYFYCNYSSYLKFFKCLQFNKMPKNSLKN